MLEVKITKLQETMIPQADQTLKKGIRVTYNVGKHGPFTKEFPEGTGQGIAIRAAIDEHARELSALVGE